ncbi:MAG: hypothetical protein A2W77_02035 [Nitrospinae bacterium RIFCSPLOWO2_12_39_16]|nr:MAG: hypothetical protein A2W77_02035 [Nitrospinae bacterium RIFCSPLOWO2_12_39_16]
MQAIKALYNGRDIKPMEEIKTKKKTEVIVIFPNEIEERVTPEDARRFLRGSGKGERLTEKLLKSRAEDISLEGN